MLALAYGHIYAYLHLREVREMEERVTTEKRRESGPPARRFPGPDTAGKLAPRERV